MSRISRIPWALLISIVAAFLIGTALTPILRARPWPTSPMYFCLCLISGWFAGKIDRERNRKG